jgi:hypothetical protein
LGIYGSLDGWNYIGQTMPAITGPGELEIEARVARFDNSFGYGTTAHTGTTTVFAPNAGVGTRATIAGLSPNYQFWFGSDPAGTADDNVQWTDGFATGGAIGITQGDIDIFNNPFMRMWAFFFDDGGNEGAIEDDNDYNDMVVTFQETGPVRTPTGVPAPAALSLVSLGLLGVAAARKGRVRT